MITKNGISYFNTEKEEKKANWPCIMCECGPEKQHAVKPPKICCNCDSFSMPNTKNTNKNHKPNNFESMKIFLIPTGLGFIGQTAWDCQKLRDTVRLESKK